MSVTPLNPGFTGGGWDLTKHGLQGMWALGYTLNHVNWPGESSACIISSGGPECSAAPSPRKAIGMYGRYVHVSLATRAGAKVHWEPLSASPLRGKGTGEQNVTNVQISNCGREEQ